MKLIINQMYCHDCGSKSSLQLSSLYVPVTIEVNTTSLAVVFLLHIISEAKCNLRKSFRN